MKSTVDPAAGGRNPSERVLATATALFNERGAEHVGTDEIAARARVSKTSMYKHFPSRDELTAAVVRHRSRVVHDGILADSQAEEPGRARVLGMCDRLIEWFGSPEFHGCLVMNTAVGSRGAGGTADVALGHLQRYRDFLEAELTTARFEDPAQLARSILLVIEGATLMRSIGVRSAGTDARVTILALLDHAE